jgi:hypothetical protein
MNQRIALLAMAAFAATCCAAVQAAEDPSMAKDLKVTIALQGLPCDQIVSSKRVADSDYQATCKDGNHYHVYVDANGRVVVDKLK